MPAEALADPTPEAMGRYWVERWIWERDTHRMTVAERAGALVGFTHLGPDDEDDPATGLLNAIHLDPAEQGRGVGRALWWTRWTPCARRAGDVRALGAEGQRPRPLILRARRLDPHRRRTRRGNRVGPDPTTPLHPPPLNPTRPHTPNPALPTSPILHFLS